MNILLKSCIKMGLGLTKSSLEEKKLLTPIYNGNGSIGDYPKLPHIGATWDGTYDDI